jgi:DNA-binding NarL/FixJ family response regulator
LHTLCPAAALVLIADDGWLDSVVATINAGVQGYLTNEMQPTLALQALSFVLHGGSYFPPNAIIQPFSRTGFSFVKAEEHPEIYNYASPGATPDQGPLHLEPSDILNTSNASGQVLKTNFVGRTSEEMSERQRSVLEGLCRGDPNKVIGRRLGMTETMVKVHVREIMRKLGVANRTQVALAVERNGRDLGCSASTTLRQIEGLHGGRISN